MERAELVDVNPTYANIRYPNGRETSISLKDSAPYPSSTSEPSEGVDETAQLADSVADGRETSDCGEDQVVRRSELSTKGIPPDRLQISL